MTRKNKSNKKAESAKKKEPVLSIFNVAVFFTILMISVGLWQMSDAFIPVKESPYSSMKPLHAFSDNGERAAWVNVTLRTVEGVPQVNKPINVTIEVRGIIVSQNEWMYALMDGATAAFPNKEPNYWVYTPKGTIVLNQSKTDPYRFRGSRIMNYTSEGDWNILLHVTPNTNFIIDNIPLKIINDMTIYTVPNAIHISQAESIAQIKTLNEAVKSTSFWAGLGLCLAATGPLFVAWDKKKKVKTAS